MIYNLKQTHIKLHSDLPAHFFFHYFSTENFKIKHNEKVLFVHILGIGKRIFVCTERIDNI